MVKAKTSYVVAGILLAGAGIGGLIYAAKAGKLGVPIGSVKLQVSDPQMRGRLVGRLAETATVTATGIVTAGDPLPSMILELWDTSVTPASPIKSQSFLNVPLNTPQTVSHTFSIAGHYEVMGSMFLENPVDVVNYLTPVKEFDIGPMQVAPAGTVTIAVA